MLLALSRRPWYRQYFDLIARNTTYIVVSDGVSRMRKYGGLLDSCLENIATSPETGV